MEILYIALTPTGHKKTCHVKQYDVGRIIRLILEYTIHDDDVITLNVKKPNEDIISFVLPIVHGNTFIDLSTTLEMDDIAGVNECELKITTRTAEFRTEDFLMEVQESKEPAPAPAKRRGGLNSTNLNVISTTYETQ